MTPKILLTGAGGYVGGSVLAEFRNRQSGLFKPESIIATVRSKEQAQVLADKGINVVQVNLSEEQAVAEVIGQHSINIVIHCAGGIETAMSANLVRALGKRKRATGEKLYFIHTSGGGAFSEKGGWPHGEIKDTDEKVFELEKQVAESSPLRKTDVTATELAEENGVASYVVVPPLIYGRGRGELRKLSVCIPSYVRSGIQHKKIYRFTENTVMPAVHISDVSSLYFRLIEGIIRGEDIPSGKNGYVFTAAHTFHWWEFLDLLAGEMKSRQLVDTVSVQTWPSDELAAESLGIPVQFVNMFWNSETPIVSMKARQLLDWDPAWGTEEKLQGTIGEEVQAVLDLDAFKSTFFDKLGQ